LIFGSYTGTHGTISGSASYAQENANSQEQSQAAGRALTEETHSDNVRFLGGEPSEDYQEWCTSVTQKPALIDPMLEPIHFFLKKENLGSFAQNLTSAPTTAEYNKFLPVWGRRHWCNGAGAAESLTAPIVSCKCDTGYEGANCQFTTLDNCAENRCSGHGKCFTMGGCLCNPGKRGERCDADTIEAQHEAAATQAAANAGWFTYTGPGMMFKTQSPGGTGGTDFDSTSNFKVGHSYFLKQVKVTAKTDVDGIKLVYEEKGPDSEQSKLVTFSAGNLDKGLPFIAHLPGTRTLLRCDPVQLDSTSSQCNCGPARAPTAMWNRLTTFTAI